MSKKGHFNLMNVPFVDLKAQYASIQEPVDAAMRRVIDRTAFILGAEVDEFEDAFAAYCHARYAVGVDSGTSALELILRAYGIGEGDEVIVPANTYIATALAVSYAGARPVLVDIDEKTYNIDPNRIEDAITDRTKAIMPVHLYGQPTDMDAIIDIALRHELLILEDASQAHGSCYKGRRVGTFGPAAGFSLYPGKNLGGYGDAGIVVTQDEKVADKLRMLRNYGQREKYYHEEVGFNRRLDTLQAAVLNVKLPHLDGWNDARRRNAALYTELLAGNPAVVTPFVPDFVDPVWHLYVVRVAERDTIRRQLGEHGIQTGVHYPVPIHLQKAYCDLGYKQGDFPITEAVSNEILSLPMYPELTPDMIAYVVQTLETLTQPVEQAN